jgi:hypothetical protein
MKPAPWSFSALDDFVNCPRAYHEKRVLKNYKEEKSPQMIWGEYVHKEFENRQINPGYKLPLELEGHEPYMKLLEDRSGDQLYVEQKVAFNKQAQPCAFFAQDVWCRIIIDFIKIHENSAKIVDYKTGKPHTKFKQLQLAALHTFALYPEVDLVNAEFYWTKTMTKTKKIWSRTDIPIMWAAFVPDLKQYATAFKTDVWQPRQSGLCNGWCPVTECEFWKPKRTFKNA